jgi:hypothetical protein
MCGMVRPSLRTDLFRGGIMMPSQLPGAEWWVKEGENKGREERVGERGQGERKISAGKHTPPYKTKIFVL